MIMVVRFLGYPGYPYSRYNNIEHERGNKGKDKIVSLTLSIKPETPILQT